MCKDNRDWSLIQDCVFVVANFLTLVIISSVRLRVLDLITYRRILLLAPCWHLLVQLTSILHLRWDANYQTCSQEQKNCYFNLFISDQIYVLTYFSDAWCVSQPRNSMPKYMEPNSEDKMEKAIPKWYVVFWLYYIIKLQTLNQAIFYYLIGATHYTYWFDGLFSWNNEEYTCIHL